ncbi:hypothetical protein J2W56_005979 [Nocardia kruczakiae]|uniref:Small integral membrane protein n=1 Tax=Nocardia kruczakiae TaxID=261477 RepID=A0ABU1XNT0_9NOCA|nr:hypothetical protein [Nocardia kruczakiae]MDR7172218.1 hypothetical protein [Nocardia kruczakiae]
MTEPSPDPRVMEVYKLAVEMADRVSARRAVANAFFLTVNTTLVAVVGLQPNAERAAPLSVAVCVAGVVVAGCWLFLLQNYRRLNEAKFVVINRIEDEHLPIKVFKDEWALLGGDATATGRAAKVKVGLKQLGGVERLVPWVFALLYIVLLIGRLIS